MANIVATASWLEWVRSMITPRCSSDVNTSRPKSDNVPRSMPCMEPVTSLSKKCANPAIRMPAS